MPGTIEKTKVISIYPHPDDETMSVGGYLARLAARPGYDVHSLTVTAGEKGDELLKLPAAELAAVRRRELAQALGKLGIKSHTVWDFPDGGLAQVFHELKSALRKYLQQLQPDTVITYESGGVYGHPDHVALAHAIYELAGEFPGMQVLYSTLPERMFRRMNLPLHMAGGRDVLPQTPEFSVAAGRMWWRKYRAAAQYRSQNISRGFPLFLMLLFTNHEYFTTKFNPQPDITY